MAIDKCPPYLVHHILSTKSYHTIYHILSLNIFFFFWHKWIYIKNKKASGPSLTRLGLHRERRKGSFSETVGFYIFASIEMRKGDSDETRGDLLDIAYNSIDFLCLSVVVDCPDECLIVRVYLELGELEFHCGGDRWTKRQGLCN